LDQVYNGVGCLIYSHRGVLGNQQSRLHTWEMDPILVFPLSQWYLDNLLNDSLGSPVMVRWNDQLQENWGIGILTVGGMQVDGQAQ